ncbi:MAG: WhiB family transcriptional regulator [Nocardioides sp.]|jgi:WhiB family redox-sensing transcriptional regulator
MAEPACATASDPDAWFASPADQARRAYALAHCRGCPVRERCLELALASSEEWSRYGIWGGVTAEERLAGAVGGAA